MGRGQMGQHRTGNLLDSEEVGCGKVRNAHITGGMMPKAAFRYCYY